MQQLENSPALVGTSIDQLYAARYKIWTFGVESQFFFAQIVISIYDALGWRKHIYGGV